MHCKGLESWSFIYQNSLRTDNDVTGLVVETFVRKGIDSVEY